MMFLRSSLIHLNKQDYLEINIHGKLYKKTRTKYRILYKKNEQLRT
jgi:hypothetical protein